MEFNIKHSVLFISVVLTALSAGLFYAWVVSVIPGTKKIPDQAYLETVQSINREILNVGFLTIFFGALVFLIVSTFLQYQAKVDTVFYLTLAALLVYAIGTLGVTMFGNVPLNNVMEALDISSFTAEDFEHARAEYEARWNSFNLIRTFAAL
ncbi:MAG: DUF1772 domain-containing protein, partial [Bacteroidia bacterium]